MSEKVTVKFAKTRPDAKVPVQEKGSAGLDFYACFDESYMIIPSHKTVLVPTGLKMAIQEGYFIWLAERGSTGSKGIKRSAGIIDNNFRGIAFMAVTNTNDWDICIYKNDAASIDDMYNAMMSEAEKRDDEMCGYIADKCTILEDAVQECFTEDWTVKDTNYMHFYPYSKAVFQGIVLPQYEVISEEVSESEIDKMETTRGAGMLGSSGK